MENTRIYDAAVIGTGPAGFSAALNLKLRGADMIWIGSPDMSLNIQRAERILNYPGLPDISGEALAEAFRSQAAQMDLKIIPQMVNQMMLLSGHYALMAGNEYYEARTVILTTGTVRTAVLSGEDTYLGHGVSYCATCDGELYRGRTIAAFLGSARFEAEAHYLASLAKTVYIFTAYPNRKLQDPSMVHETSQIKRISGEKRVNRIELQDGRILPVDGVFLLRESVAMSSLLPQLRLEDGHIAVDRMMRTNLPGIYAAGDCTGRPYQYAKAIGEGNVAAHSVLEYLAEKKAASRN